MYINNMIKQKEAEASAIALQIQAEDKYVPTKKVKDQIMGHILPKYADNYLLGLKHTSTVGTHNRYITIVQKIKPIRAPRLDGLKKSLCIG